MLINALKRPNDEGGMAARTKYMPVEDSRIKGFFRHTVSERRQIAAELAGLEKVHTDAWSASGELLEEDANRMIENVVGTMSLPVGVATNFVVDGKSYLIPFVLEIHFR